MYQYDYDVYSCFSYSFFSCNCDRCCCCCCCCCCCSEIVTVLARTTMSSSSTTSPTTAATRLRPLDGNIPRGTPRLMSRRCSIGAASHKYVEGDILRQTSVSELHSAWEGTNAALQERTQEAEMAAHFGTELLDRLTELENEVRSRRFLVHAALCLSLRQLAVVNNQPGINAQKRFRACNYLCLHHRSVHCAPANEMRGKSWTWPAAK